MIEFVENNIDTLATALYTTCDDYLNAHPELLPPRPKIGIHPRITDAEIITLAVVESLQGYTSQRHFIRHAKKCLTSAFPYIPQQSGYNKRLRKLTETMQHVMTHLATSTGLLNDDVWVVDSTPVECGRSRETVKRSDLAGYAEYGYCASHSRFFWGCRLHLITTLHGLPVGYALTGAKADERTALVAIINSLAPRSVEAITLMADKGYAGKDLETLLHDEGITLLRPAKKRENPRSGKQFLKPLRQTIESVFNTMKSQLHLEQHGSRTAGGLVCQVVKRLLALTAAIWHNHVTGQPVLRSLIAYDH